MYIGIVGDDFERGGAVLVESAFGAKLNQLAQNPAGAIQLVQGAIEDAQANRALETFGGGGGAPAVGGNVFGIPPDGQSTDRVIGSPVDWRSPQMTEALKAPAIVLLDEATSALGSILVTAVL